MMPQRIQRQRTKGWRMPENAVYVGRPTRWGNHWHTGNGWDAAAIVALHAEWMRGTYCDNACPPKPDLGLLRGKDLACWCPLDQPCHADVLLELANR
jgi:hypothetical protein